MSLLRSVIDATDRLAREPIRSRGLLFFPIAPWFLVAVYRSAATIAVAALLSIGALAFVCWRYWVVMRAEAAEHDERYDREGKFKLSSEYHETESATAAARRKAETP